jgi:thiamine-monophosphate kinase
LGSRDQSLGELGEHVFLGALCGRLRRRRESGVVGNARVVVEPGDDCAVLAPSGHPIALTTDALVEGVHFRSTWLTPAELGARAAYVSLSDLAAMAATPTALLLAVGAPEATSTAALDAIVEGCAAACEEAGAALVGGNLTRADALILTSTAIGEVRGRCLERSGARPGDILVVSGTLGDAALAVDDWLAGREPPPAVRARWTAPAPRLALARALADAGARAAIDLSDGLLADLGHLCHASGLGARIERERLPRSAAVAARDADGADFALAGGEDYEVLFACPPELEEALPRLAREVGAPLTVIGRCTEGGEVLVLDAGGHRHSGGAIGYDHFTAGTRRGRSR